MIYLSRRVSAVVSFGAAVGIAQKGLQAKPTATGREMVEYGIHGMRLALTRMDTHDAAVFRLVVSEIATAYATNMHLFPQRGVNQRRSAYGISREGPGGVTERNCSKCRQWKTVNDENFYFNKAKGYYNSRCLDCKRAEFAAELPCIVRRCKAKKAKEAS